MKQPPPPPPPNRLNVKARAMSQSVRKLLFMRTVILKKRPGAALVLSLDRRRLAQPLWPTAAGTCLDPPMPTRRP